MSLYEQRIDLLRRKCEAAEKILSRTMNVIKYFRLIEYIEHHRGILSRYEARKRERDLTSI